MIFLDISVFESQKKVFLWFSVFSVLYSISVIFLCFPYRGKLATLHYLQSSLHQCMAHWTSQAQATFYERELPFITIITA